MDFSSLASYWQIKALLMLEPSVVTPQNQYFPANSERMSVHCLESGCIGKYTHLGPRDFPRVGILHPSALEIALGLRPRAISRASGCKIPALGKSLGPRGVYFPIHPSSRQCTDTIPLVRPACRPCPLATHLYAPPKPLPTHLTPDYCSSGEEKCPT